MQKFTIFTIIFSVVVVTITTELVIQDYLQKLYPPAETLQANSLEKDDFNVFYPDNEEDPVSREPEEEPSEEPSEETDEPEDRTDRVREILDRRRGGGEEATETEEEDRGTAPIEVVRVKRLLPALNIDGVELKNANYPGKLFHLIETTDLDVVEAAYGLFNVNNGTVGSVYEFRFKNELRAEEAYTIIKARASAIENVETNATDQFGERSFYINNVVKVGEVFILFQQDNYIYAFAYKKEYHEIFKAFFAVIS